ncbi:Pentatricopeptide repeat [Dillenia turbinata]|uniref:Pentatricopeptide repeat n=1 Tax=Dillenia turbinata TaxID=194707 RepID=A0AAN8WFE6_9MAGN
MDQESIAFWSAIIAAHAGLKLWRKCLRLFRDIFSEGCWGEHTSWCPLCLHFLDRRLREVCFTRGRVGCLSKHGYEKPVVLQCNDLWPCLSWKRQGSSRVFAEMLEEGLQRDDVVYVGVWSACSNAGLVNEGLQYFERMKSERGIEPEIQHYGCTVDLLHMQRCS